MKKRIVSIMLTLCMLFGMASMFAIGAGAATEVTPEAPSGAGTEESPYLIDTAGKLQWMSNDLDACYKLTANITMNAGSGSASTWGTTAPAQQFTPVGTSGGASFTGTFDGNGMTISGLYVKNGDGDNCGIFGVIGGGAIIKDFAIVNSYFASAGKAAAIASKSMSKAGEEGNISISSIYVDAVITVINTAAKQENAAGILATLDTSTTCGVTIDSCVFAGSALAYNWAGGIVGNANKEALTVSNCLNIGAIDVNNQYNCGIVARQDNGSSTIVENCVNLSALASHTGTNEIIAAGGTTKSNASTVISCYCLSNPSGVNVGKNIYFNGTWKDYCKKTHVDSTYVRSSINDFIGLDAAVTIEGWTKRDGDLMVPSGVASFAPRAYCMVTWKNHDNTTLATDYVKVGTTPTYRGSTPMKSGSYVFDKWSPDLAPATDNVVYTAQFVAGDPSWYNAASTELTISSADQLITLPMIVSGAMPGIAKDNFAGKTVKLGADIDLTGIVWKPIGDSAENAFKGEFDGQGNTISGITLSASSGVTGLFGYIGGSAYLHDLRIVNSTFTSTTHSVGALVGQIAAGTMSANQELRISNVTVNANVTGQGYIGGLVGQIDGGASLDGTQKITVTSCVASGNVTISNSSERAAGGIIGSSKFTGLLTFKDCINYACISGGRYNLGGILGQTSGDAVTKTVFDGCVNLWAKEFKFGTASSPSRGEMLSTNVFKNGSTLTITNCYGASRSHYLASVEIAAGATVTLTVDGHTEEITKASKDTVYEEETAGFTGTAKTYNLVEPSMESGASVRLVAASSGIRFTATMEKVLFDLLVGQDAEIGVLIAPTDYVATAGEFTVEALEDLAVSGTKYVAINAVNKEEDGEDYVFSGVLINLKAGNYARAFSARVYIKINGIYIYPNTYSEANHSRSISAVANAALSDTRLAADATYRYEIGETGYFSPFNEEQRTILDSFTTATLKATLLKTMSINMKNSYSDSFSNLSNRTTAFKSLLTTEEIDVAGLQEVGYVNNYEAGVFRNEFEKGTSGGWREWLEDGGLTASGYAYVGYYTNHTGEGGVIVYNAAKYSVVESGCFWLHDSAPTAFEGEVCSLSGNASDYDRLCTWALLEETATGNRFLFATTHYAAGEEYSTHRKESSTLIRDTMYAKSAAFGNCPVVITGDFNSGDNAQSVMCLQTIDADEDGTPEWKGEFKLAQKANNLDYIFTSIRGTNDMTELAVGNHGTIGIGIADGTYRISDHNNAAYAVVGFVNVN